MSTSTGARISPRAIHAAFPDAVPGTVSISYGPLALDYVLARGGSGYFRMAAVRPYIVSAGRLALVPDSPEFSYSAYAVHLTRADEIVMAQFAVVSGRRRLGWRDALRNKA